MIKVPLKEDSEWIFPLMIHGIPFYNWKWKMEKKGFIPLEGFINSYPRKSQKNRIYQKKTWSLQEIKKKIIQVMLIKDNQKNIPPLLTHPNREVQNNAIVALAYYKEKALPELRIALKHNREEIRLFAIKLIGKLLKKGSVAKDDLILLLQDSSPTVREYAILALGNLKDPSSIAPMITLLQDKSWKIRYNVTYSLGKFKKHSKIVLLPLISALGDKNPFVRGSASRSLGELGNQAKSAIPALKKLLDDHDMGSHEAQLAIQKIQGN